MHYLYLIRSLSSPGQTYVGLTDDLKQRLIKHNAGGSAHTSKYVPWEIVSYHAFAEKQRAVDFEPYLNPVPARHFPKKRFW